MNKRKSITLLVISIVLILLLGVMTFCPVVVPLGNVDYHSPVTLIEYGLDLKGGYFVTFEVNKNELSDSEYAEGFDEVIDTLEDRMSLIESRMGIQGFTEALVASSPAEGLVSVEVPATESALSISDVFDILGSKGELVISLNEDGSEPFIPKNAQGDELTWNDCIVRADAIYDSSTSSYGIYVEFDDFGLEALKEGTSAITSSTPIYFILDGETISNPNVSSQITSNYSQITGLSTPVAAQTMAIQFMSGQLSAGRRQYDGLQRRGSGAWQRHGKYASSCLCSYERSYYCRLYRRLQTDGSCLYAFLPVLSDSAGFCHCVHTFGAVYVSRRLCRAVFRSGDVCGIQRRFARKYQFRVQKGQKL